MRAFLNAILAGIETTSLTDDEFGTVVATVAIYDQASYDDLARILAARESVSDVQARLLGYYQAKGFSASALSTASSKIYVGDVLE